MTSYTVLASRSAGVLSSPAAVAEKANSPPVAAAALTRDVDACNLGLREHLRANRSIALYRNWEEEEEVLPFATSVFAYAYSYHLSTHECEIWYVLYHF